jgi:selenoprotein W-related protein
VSLAGELLKAYEFQLERLELIPGAGGVFEVTVDGHLVFSKRAAQRHAYAGEVMDRVREQVGPPAEKTE